MTDQYKLEDTEAIKALPILKERTAQLLRAAGMADVKVISDHSNLCDPFIEFDGTGIGVLITHYDKPALVWDHWDNEKGGTVRALAYQPYTTYYHPGVMYHPDGSGTPPETDIEDADDITEHLDEAITSAIVLLVRERISQHIEHDAERIIEAEEEHYERLAAKELGL